MITSKTFRCSAAVPRKGMVRAHVAHTARKWSQSQSSPGVEQAKVERRKTSRHKLSEILLVLYSFCSVWYFFSRSTLRVGAVRLRDLAHCCLLWWRSSKTANGRPSAILNYRVGLSKHTQTLRRSLRLLPLSLLVTSPAPWLFAGSLDGISTFPSMLAAELALPLLLVASSNSEPCLRGLEFEVETGEIDYGPYSRLGRWGGHLIKQKRSKSTDPTVHTLMLLWQWQWWWL